MSNIKLFESKKVRSQWNEDEQKWYFSIIDVIEILTDAENPRRYWSDLKRKLKKEGFNELYEKIVQLKMEAKDGKRRETDATDATILLRIIQSIPSQKAEPFKQWLAQVGYERLEEIENPEIATKRIKETYKMKGYSDEWIEKRIRGIVVRDELTEEWKRRGVKVHKEYSILTAEISNATFGMTPSEYKKLKELDRPKENLRDHMTDLELIFTMLGEASTTEIAKNRDTQGFIENFTAAHEGGTVAGNARKELETKTGRKVVTKDNYKNLTEGKISKQLKDKK